MNESKLADLKQRATDIRRMAIESIYHARSGHPGGCLSVADILSVLYFDFLRVDPKSPDDPTRDRFVLSKGHACPALYAALAIKGYFPHEELSRLRKLDSLLQGHPDTRTPGIDVPSGSLGMGLSQGLGMAMAGQYLQQDFQVVVVLGDGDMQEGNTWEALMAAGHHQVENLTAIYDANGMQGEDWVEIQMNHLPMLNRLDAMGWDSQEINGHDINAIRQSLKLARKQKRPSFIKANTIKGKGIAMMENSLPWHGSVEITGEELTLANSQLKLSSQLATGESNNEYA